MRNRKIHREDSTEVDMTPMLDIVFIMLIFFIVTTSFVKESAIDIYRPQKSPDEDHQITTTLAIQINEFEEISFANRIIQQDSVRANIEVERSKDPNINIIVTVAENVDTGILVSVVNQAKLAGIEKVTVTKMADS